MRIVYMGSPEVAVAPLEYLVNSGSQLGLEVLGVISNPPAQGGRGRRLIDPPVAVWAKEKGIPVFQPQKASDPMFLKELADLNIDVAVTCAFGQILNTHFLAVPRRATINIHPSKLPLHRGATPAQASILAGDQETAVSILFTVKALDAGNIILQKPFAIGEFETAGELLKRLFRESGPLLVDALKLLKDPDFLGTEQDAALATHCSKIAKEDGLVQWADGGMAIMCRYRAYCPWPGSFTYYQGKRIVMEGLCPTSRGFDSNIPPSPGEFRFDKKSGHLIVKVGDGCLSVEKLKPEGSKLLSARDFWNGLKTKEHSKFGSLVGE